MEQLLISKDWLPTPESINALPKPLRRYIHDLETSGDPADLVQENICLKDQNEALQMIIKKMKNEE